MNIFEKMQSEISDSLYNSINSKDLSKGHVATMVMEVAWRNEEDRREAELLANKYRQFISKGGMVKGQPINANVMLSTSWSDPDVFFQKHPEEHECTSGEGSLLKEKTLDKIACRITYNSNNGFKFIAVPDEFKLGNINSVIEIMLGNEYSVPSLELEDMQKFRSKIRQEMKLYDWVDLKSHIVGIMYNFLNKTITLDKFGKSGSYPDLTFEMVEVKPLNCVFFRKANIDMPLEFEKTGKTQEFLKKD